MAEGGEINESIQNQAVGATSPDQTSPKVYQDKPLNTVTNSASYIGRQGIRQDTGGLLIDNSLIKRPKLAKLPKANKGKNNTKM